jgi:ligand-binding SRPBCC domain-containing protein
VLIRIETLIGASPEACFDLACDLNANARSIAKTDARVISGPPSGRVGLNDEVTFETRRFFLRQKLTAKIVEFDRPREFTDRMLRGPFAGQVHRHVFQEQDPGTLMIDLLEVVTPPGILGPLSEWVLRDAYTKSLREGGLELKRMIEAKW